MKLNKQALAKVMAERYGLTEAAAYEMITQTFDTLADQLLRGNSFTLRAFGAFRPAKAIQRGTYKSNLTGESVTRRPLARIHFVASDTLRKKLVFNPK